MLRSVMKLSVAVALVLFVAAPERAAPQSFGEEISVSEVEIPVQVLRDRDPVLGLGPDDFQVLDDGEPVPITAFRVIDVSAPGVSRAPEGSRPEAAPEGRRILVLFDFAFSRPHDLSRAVRGVYEMFASQLTPSDQVAVAVFDRRGGRLILGFSSDKREIEAALDVVAAQLDGKPREVHARYQALAALEGEGVTAPSARTALLSKRLGPAGAIAVTRGVDLPAIGGGGPLLTTPARTGGSAIPRDEVSSDPVVVSLVPATPEAIGRSLARGEVASNVRTLALEVADLTTLLRDVPGQKRLLFLSEGFPSSVIEAPRSGNRVLVQRYLERMFEALRRSGWTVDAIDIQGIPDAFQRGFDAHALFYISDEMGGQLLENYNQVAQATDELLRRTSVTYVLTIRPGDLPADGRYHRLTVRLRDAPATARVFHRPGYYDPKPPDARSPLERRLDSAELLLGDFAADSLGVEVEAAGEGAGAGDLPVALMVGVPTESLVGGRRAGRLRLEVQAYVVDAQGGVRDVWQRRVDLDLAKLGPSLETGGVRLFGRLEAPAGEYRLRVLVREPESETVSLTTAELELPGAGQGLPEELLTVPRGWIDIR